MKNLIIQSQYQKDNLISILSEEICLINHTINVYQEEIKKYGIDNFEDDFLKHLDDKIQKRLELKNLLDQLNRMGDFIK